MTGLSLEDFRLSTWKPWPRLCWISGVRRICGIGWRGTAEKGWCVGPKKVPLRGPRHD